jgi:hypothetical protein
VAAVAQAGRWAHIMRYYAFLAGFGLAFLLMGCSAPERRQTLVNEPTFASSFVWEPAIGYERVDEHPMNELRRAALQDCKLLCESFAHASEANLGKPADEAGITEAILAYLREHNPPLSRVHSLIQIRWLSPTVVVAVATVHHGPFGGSSYYCVRLNKDGRWDTLLSLPKENIMPPEEWPPRDPAIELFAL